MKTIKQDLKSNNLFLNEATDVAQNCPLWRVETDVYMWRYTLPVDSGACQKEEDYMTAE